MVPLPPLVVVVVVLSLCRQTSTERSFSPNTARNGDGRQIERRHPETRTRPSARSQLPLPFLSLYLSICIYIISFCSSQYQARFTSPETTVGQHRSLLWLCFCVKRVYFFIFLLSFQNHLIKKTLEHWKRKKRHKKARTYLTISTTLFATDRSMFFIDGDKFLFSLSFFVLFLSVTSATHASPPVFSSVNDVLEKTSVRINDIRFILFLVL